MSVDLNLNGDLSSDMIIDEVQPSDMKMDESQSTDLKPDEIQSSDQKLDEVQSSDMNVYDIQYSNLELSEIHEAAIIKYLEDNKSILKNIFNDTELESDKILWENLASQMAELGSIKSVEEWKDAVKKMKIHSERQALKYFRYSRWTDSPITPTPIESRFMQLSKELKLLGVNPGANPDIYKDIKSASKDLIKEFHEKRRKLMRTAKFQMPFKLNKANSAYSKKLMEIYRIVQEGFSHY